MKSSIPAKIVLGTCALGAGAIAFRAVRLLTAGLACCGVKVYKIVSGRLDRKELGKKK